jgi:glycosidase
MPMKHFVLTTAFLACFTLSVQAVEISRMEPAFWWVGMHNPELQVMVYGPNIAASDVTLEYPNVRLTRTVKPENPNYLFLYLEIGKEAQPGVMKFTFTEGRKKLVKDYELKTRATSTGAQGFEPSDVLYLIMPDRFANGNPANDLMEGMEPIDRSNSFGRHGGDFNGVMKHMDYIHDLGITTIWFNPVLENAMPRGSYHGYSTTDFYKVDPRFGSNDDYCKLIEEAHQKGMKVVMDIIYNHCGSSHWWMKDLPCSDWLNYQDNYAQTTHNLFTVPDVHAPKSEVDATTKGWFTRSMPDLNQENPLLADYLIQNCIWWIEYARIDGIRHDTHPYVDFDFLARWNKAVADEYPEFNIVGESWYNLSAPVAWWQRSSKVNDRQSNLKTVMDFNLLWTINDSMPADPEKTYNWKKVYEVIAQDFLYEDLKHILTFLDNHDTSRFMKKEETDLNRYKQALAFLLTTRGIPQLYYGLEILMSGEKSEGDGNLRKDFPGGWEGDPVNAFTTAGRTDLQNQAHAYLTKLLNWRKGSSAIAEGELIHYTPDRNNCYIYARINGDDRVLVILNGSNKEVTLQGSKYAEVLGTKTVGKDVITGQTFDVRGDIVVPAKGQLILDL